MSNTIYPTARQKFGEAGISWTADDIRAVLVSDDYVYADAHEFHDDLTGIISTSANFGSKTNVLGVFDAADTLFTGVGGVDDVRAVIIYRWTGSSATSPLIAYFDRTAASVPIDVEPDTGDLIVRWSNGPNKILKL